MKNLLNLAKQFANKTQEKTSLRYIRLDGNALIACDIKTPLVVRDLNLGTGFLDIHNIKKTLSPVDQIERFNVLEDIGDNYPNIEYMLSKYPAIDACEIRGDSDYITSINKIIKSLHENVSLNPDYLTRFKDYHLEDITYSVCANNVIRLDGDICVAFQYNICVGSTLIPFYCIRSIIFISIQYLCRFNEELIVTAKALGIFQYNICVGSTNTSVPFSATVMGFQYNICVGSTAEALNCQPFGKLFQYNICVGSTFAELERNGGIIVFQYNICVGSTVGIDMQRFISTEFQYNICVGSTEVLPL